MIENENLNFIKYKICLKFYYKLSNLKKEKTNKLI